MKTIAKGVEKWEPLCTVGNVIDPATIENNMEVSPKIEVPYNPEIPLFI